MYESFMVRSAVFFFGSHTKEFVQPRQVSILQHKNKLNLGIKHLFHVVCISEADFKNITNKLEN